VTPHQDLKSSYAGSQNNLWTFSQTHISKSELKNGHISRFCSVFQVIQVISSAKFSSAEEVDLSFISWIWIHESDFKGFFSEQRPWKSFFIKCSNSGINESTPQTQSNVIWISSKAHLKISFLNSLFEKWVWESSPKIDLATGVRFSKIELPLKLLDNFFWRNKMMSRQCSLNMMIWCWVCFLSVLRVAACSMAKMENCNWTRRKRECLLQ